MKKLQFVLPFLLLLMVISAIDVHATSFREVKVTDDSNVLLKFEDNEASTTVATLQRGVFVTVFSTNDEWTYIQADGKVGYVKNETLATPISKIKIASSKSGLVVKETMDSAGNTVARLTRNMVVKDFGPVDHYWSFVQYGNVTGYVATSFIGTPNPTTQYVKMTSKLRNIASPSGAVISSLDANTEVTVHAILAGWAYVSTTETQGYTQVANLQPYRQSAVKATTYAPSCKKTHRYITGQSEYINMKCINNVWNGYKTSNSQGFNHYKLTTTNNALTYTYEGGKEIYQFPMAEGGTWTQRNPGATLIYYVLSTNETIRTSSLGEWTTHTDVIKVRVTHMESKKVKYVYLAKGIGELLIENAEQQQNWRWVTSYQ